MLQWEIESNGMLEKWKIGEMEEWKNGMLE